MIKDFLTYKYGQFVTSKILTPNEEVIWDKKDRDNHHAEVHAHLETLVDDRGNRIVPPEFLNVEWGMDISSWLGPFNGGKDFVFIGAEPHIVNNYQLVYDFGNREGQDLETTALEYAGNKKDIWHYLTNNFVTDLTESNKIDFLKRCYITDLCHLVPKGCGQVKKIQEKLGITQREWHEFRTRVAKQFLINEIKTVNPKLVVLHGASSRNFFARELGVVFDQKIPIANWTRHVYKGKFDGYDILAIPHLKGQILNELWRSKSTERRESVRSIIQACVMSRQELAK